MKRQAAILALLIMVGFAATGCEGVPVTTAESTAIVTKNTHTLADNYSKVLDGVAKLDTATQTTVLGGVAPAHEKALMASNSKLADDVNAWVQAHAKGGATTTPAPAQGGN